MGESEVVWVCSHRGFIRAFFICSCPNSSFEEVKSVTRKMRYPKNELPVRGDGIYLNQAEYTETKFGNKFGKNGLPMSFNQFFSKPDWLCDLSVNNF